MKTKQPKIVVRRDMTPDYIAAKERDDKANQEPHPGWRNRHVRTYVAELREQLRLANIDAFQANANAEKLAEAMSGLFSECVMVHEHWGENCNQSKADDAVAEARAALADWQKGEQQP